MSVGLSSLVVAGVLAFHPFGTTTQVGVAEPQPDPSWDAPEADAEPTTDAGDPADALAPVPEPTPAAPVQPTVVTRPVPNKGMGLIIGASVTGGLAWGTAIGRLVAVNRCISAIESGSIEASGIQCVFRTGPALVVLTPTGWLLNAATYGLAAGAGVVRGKYDGVNAAWDGAPERSTGAFIGSGAALLGLGVTGRLVTWFTFGRSVNRCSGGADACGIAMRMHFVGAQLSSASIAGGAGLLSYGLAYKKGRATEHDRRKAAGLVADVRLAPQLSFDYQGLSLSGRF